MYCSLLWNVVSYCGASDMNTDVGVVDDMSYAIDIINRAYLHRVYDPDLDRDSEIF